MDKYLKKLEKSVKTKKINHFYIFNDEKKFKPIKKSLEDLVIKMKKKPDKYVNRLLTRININVKPNNIKEKQNQVFGSILSISIDIGKIDKKCDIADDDFEINTFLLYYSLQELEDHPFKISNIEKLIHLVDKKKIRSGMFGISYSRLIQQLNELKKKINKK